LCNWRSSNDSISVWHLFAILCIFSPLFVSAKPLKVVSYNVENLFDMQRSGLEYREYIPGKHHWTEPILRKKLEHIAEVICDLDAEVIALQEVENDHILGRLQRTLRQVGCDYGYRAITDSKRTPIHNALLSKIPIKKRRDVVIFRNGRHRSILEVDLKTDPPLKLFVNHWKSKAGPESERLVYAKALMRRIVKLPKGVEYLILGDFNSNYNEYSTMEKKHNDTGGITGINQLLKTIRQGELLRLHTLTEGYHLNLWMELPPYARWSHNFYGDKEGIDAILIPASLHDGRGWEYQVNSFGVFKPKYLFGKGGRIKRWEYRHSRHTGKGYSDHLPVYAIFDTGPGVKSTQKEPGFLEGILSLFSFTDFREKEEKSIQRVPVVAVVPLSEKREEVSISDLYNMERLEKPVSLKKVSVILRIGGSAIIKQRPEGRAILLYRCAEGMKEGREYNILAYQKKRYKGLDELTETRVERELGAIDVATFLHVFSPDLMQEKRSLNEVVQDIEGVYAKHEITVHGRRYPIYFKKGLKRPKVGQKIRILRAQIGYYKNHNELVVWREKDYRIME